MFESVREIQLPNELKTFFKADVKLIAGNIIDGQSEVTQNIKSTTDANGNLSKVSSYNEKTEIVWIKTIDGEEFQLKLYENSKPFRKNQFVFFLINENNNVVLGFYNWNTKDSANFIENSAKGCSCLPTLFFIVTCWVPFSMLSVVFEKTALFGMKIVLILIALLWVLLLSLYSFSVISRVKKVHSYLVNMYEFFSYIKTTVKNEDLPSFE